MPGVFDFFFRHTLKSIVYNPSQLLVSQIFIQGYSHLQNSLRLSAKFPFTTNEMELITRN